MRKVGIDPYELFHAVSDVIRDPGLLLVSVDPKGRPNPMTIGWGFVGPVWNVPTFTAIVRRSRFTYGLIQRTRDFTVNVPRKGMEQAVSFCGTKSGRSVDKFADTGLTAVKARSTKSPIVKQCVAHFECSVLCQLDITKGSMSGRIKPFYRSGSIHSFFVGKILRCYAEPDYRSKLPKPT